MHIIGREPYITLETIKIVAGEKSAQTHDFQAGILRIGATYQGKPWKCKVTINQGGKNIYYRNTLAANPTNNPAELQLLPDIYEVIITPIKLEAEPVKFSIDIKAGEVTEKLVELHQFRT
jgi:hypothetical protein